MATYGILGPCLFPDVMELNKPTAYCLAHRRYCKVDAANRSDDTSFLAGFKNQTMSKEHTIPQCLTHDWDLRHTSKCFWC